MNEFIRQFLFKNELEIGFNNLSSEEWIYLWIKLVLLIGSTSFLFMIGANMWLTLFNVDFQFVWWIALLAVFAIAVVSNRSGFIISVTVGISGLLVYPFI